MNARERYLTFLNGEEPDKIPVFASDRLRDGPQGGWVRRLVRRGLGIQHLLPAYKPAFFYPFMINPYLEDVRYLQAHYMERGIAKCRHTYETPIGSVTAVTGIIPSSAFMAKSSGEYFVKQPHDWLIFNYIFRGMLDELTPSYEPIEREKDALGGTGIAIAMAEKTPFQRAWIQLASPERAFTDVIEKPEEFLTFVETQRLYHTRAAEILAECPAELVLLLDNITDVISPAFYREYCLPYYRIYSNALQGTGKSLACHMDGHLAHLVTEIARSPLDIIDSFTVPPVGNLSLRDAKTAWPNKRLTVNCPPHLALADADEVKQGYRRIVQEGGKKNLAIVHVEDLPLDKVELHLSSALDVCGY